MSKKDLDFFRWFIGIVTGVLFISFITKSPLTKVDLSHFIIVSLMNIGLYLISRNVKETEK